MAKTISKVTSEQIARILGEWVMLHRSGKIDLEEYDVVDSDFIQTIAVVFDNYALDENETDDDIRDKNYEFYIVYFYFNNDSRASFFVLVSDCFNEPSYDLEYIKERYEDDIEMQIEDVGISRKEFEEEILIIYENELPGLYS